MDVKYDQIGKGYNSTRKADPYIAERLSSLLKLWPGKQYLDIGCGTGNYTCVFAGQGFNFTGVEPSEKMLNEARHRSQNVRWLNGSAEQIPADNNEFDGVLATLTIHHWKDLKKAFAELCRVLSEDGKIVIFTSTPEQMEKYWLNHYFPEMLQDSIIQMPSLAAIQEATSAAKLRISGMENYFIKDDLQDCFLYVGKNKPEIYFDEQIRHGISSFSSLSNLGEVKNGLEMLRSDIDLGIFEEVKNRYNDKLGDYLFITIEKQGKLS